MSCSDGGVVVVVVVVEDEKESREGITKTLWCKNCDEQSMICEVDSFY